MRLGAPAKGLFNNQADWEDKSNFLVFRSLGPLDPNSHGHLPGHRSRRREGGHCEATKNGQGVPVTHETHPGDIYPFNDNNIFSSFAMRDVAKQERRAHGYALSGDCAMLKLPSL